MGAYILRRLLLIIPTLFGIMVVNFSLTQFVPGGPIDQAIARFQGEGDVFEGIAGGGEDTAGFNEGGGSDYLGAEGLPQSFLDRLELQYGFARIVCADDYSGEPSLDSETCEKELIPASERFFIMMWKYIRFDFGESYTNPGRTVTELIIEKLPVSISLGLWSTLIAYLVSIPLGIAKAQRDGTSFDSWTSGAIIVGYAIPGFLFAVLLMVLFVGGNCFRLPYISEIWPGGAAYNPTCRPIFPLRGLVSDNWEELSWGGKILDYFWHMTLPIVASTISAFATLTLLTKNSFMDEIKKQYVITARAKGLNERRVLYGHVFRNAMLIVIAGFPAVFIGIFFAGSLIIETLFSLDGLGRLGFEAAVARDYPVVFGTLFIFGLLGLLIGILSDLMYILVDPRIDFEKRTG